MANKIFISIAAWRDPFVIQTLKSLYSNAYKPDNVVACVIFQGYDYDRDKIRFIEFIHPNIKVLWVDAMQAPINLCKIRGRMMRDLVTDESYFLQIDSHTKMAKHWDVGLIAQLNLAEKYFGKSIIQGHSALFNKWSEPFYQPPLTSIPDEDIFFMQGSTLYGHVKVKPENTLVKEKFFNANSVFSRINFIYDVPQPDDIPFDFEQPIMAMRTWTAGYNLVSPTLTYTNCFDYNGPGEKEPYERNVRKADPNFKRAYKKAHDAGLYKFYKVFALKENSESYGPLGNRSIDDYVEWLGFNPLTYKLTREAEIAPLEDSVRLADDELEKEIELIKNARNL